MGQPDRHQYDYDQDQQTDIAEPGRWKVLLLNDDYSTMEFVIEVLVKIFKKSPQEAGRIMLEVHQKGQGVCGVYSYEIAEAKIGAVAQMAKQAGHPLRAVMTEE